VAQKQKLPRQLSELKNFIILNRMVDAMKKTYTPNSELKGDKAAFNKLDRAIKSAIKRDPKLSFEYEEEKINLNIAAILHELRTEAGLTQREVAKRAGLTQPFVARIENPTSSKKPSLETLAKLAFAFEKQLKIEFV
jgi:DNA-binding XRE family transcriptional regulator